MKFYDSNTLDILFSRSCQDVYLRDFSDDAWGLYLTVTSDDVSISNELSPLSSGVRVRLSEILRSLEYALFSLEDVVDSGYGTFAVRRVELAAYMDSSGESATWTSPFISGGSHLDNQALIALEDGAYWLTFRTQTSYTFRFSKEILAAFIPNHTRFDVVFHFVNAGKVTGQIVAVAAATNTVFALDCSYSRMRVLADELGYQDDAILAYDIMGTAEPEDGIESSGFPVGQRFIVARNNSRVKGWMFRNSLGSLDTVYSFGDVKRDVDSETKTFRRDRMTGELENYSNEVWSVDTGYVADKQALELWYEFFRSKERYVVLEDSTVVPVVVDEFNAEHIVNAAGSMSFKCRLSKEREGYDFTRAALADFSDEFT